MKQILSFIGLAIVILTLHSCFDSHKDPSTRTYESSYSSSSTATASSEDDAYTNNSLSTGSNPYQTASNSQESLEDNPYYNNSLNTGSSPYPSSGNRGEDSQISIRTSSNANCDVVVIVKKHGNVYANAYIAAGASYTFDLPNGTYQVFFYGGRGWNPNKKMPNGRTGGFVANESYSKDSPIALEYQSLEYELIPQPNGNFSTQPSNASEVF